MTRPVLLDSVAHHDLRVVPDNAEAARLNQCVVFPTEFEALQREFPIVLRHDAEGWRAVVLLGLDREENLFLDADGRWRTRYVPALLRRGPFSIGLPAGGEGEPMIHVDMDDARVGVANGERVFREHGGHAPYLDQAGEALRTIYAGVEASGPLFAALSALELIEPVTLQIEIDDGKRYHVPDCHTIRHDRLMRLDGDALERLHRADHLRHALWLSSSLGNVARLADLKLARGVTSR